MDTHWKKHVNAQSDESLTYQFMMYVAMSFCHAIAIVAMSSIQSSTPFLDNIAEEQSLE